MLCTMTQLRKQIMMAAANAGEGHIPSALSILDVIWVLYDKILSYNPRDPAWERRDRFVLSKGHGSLALYVVLAAKGFFDKSELGTFANVESRFGGHPDCNKVPGVEASTGSLGHGFPMAVGMALGLRIKQSQSRVFTLIGDGECNEGTIWEASLLASHHKLANLCCILDYNHSTDRAVSLGNIVVKFEAFDWACSEIDGHDHKAIYQALSHLHPVKPTAVIVRTIKGKGYHAMENNPAWHHRSPSPDELDAFLRERS